MSRTKKNSPSAYNDVKFVMDMAVEKPGLRYVLESPGRATHFKQRCNRYRNLLREQAQEQGSLIPGYRAETVYDILVIRQINAEGKPDRSGAVLIFDHHVTEGRLYDPVTGEEIIIGGPNLDLSRED